MTQLQIEAKRQEQARRKEDRDNIVRIVCALVSSGAEYDTFSEAVDEAIGLYNEINSRV